MSQPSLILTGYTGVTGVTGVTGCTGITGCTGPAGPDLKPLNNIWTATNTFQGTISITSTGSATATNTGALQVTNGVGIGENIQVGGITKIWNTTNSTATNTGALQVLGGVGIAKDMYINGNINVNTNINSNTASLINRTTVTPSFGVNTNIGIYANYNYNISMAVSQDSSRLVALANVNGITGGTSAANAMYLATYNYATSSWNNFSSMANFTTGLGYYSVALSNTGTRGVVTIQSATNNGGGVYYFTWNGTTYTTPAQITDTTSRYYRTIDVTPDGSRLVVVCASGVTVPGIYWADWSGSNYGTLTATLETNNNIMNGCFGIAISPDKSKIAYADVNTKSLYYASWNGTTYGTSTLIGTYSGSYSSRAVRFSTDGNIIFLSMLNANIVYYSLWNGTSFGALTSIPNIDSTATDNWILTVDGYNNLYYGRFGASGANIPINKMSYYSSNQISVGTSIDNVRVPGILYCPGMIVQVVVRKTNTDTAINTATTWTPTDVYATIIPKYSNSLLLVQANVAVNSNSSITSSGVALNFYRDGVADNTLTGSASSTTTNALAYGGYAGVTSTDIYQKVSMSTTYVAGSTASTTIKVYGYIFANTTGKVGNPNTWGRSEVVIYEIMQ